MINDLAISPHITLHNTRIDATHSERQYETARAICDRLGQQPGVILADDVGMGKTFVALAVAASVIHSGAGRQVVIMVPSAVAGKWPGDWSVFRDKCLVGGPPIRATPQTITQGSEFLKLLDDPPRTRKHLIFVTHWAMTSRLQDPFIKLAIIREAFKYQRNLAGERASLPRWAAKLLGRSDFTEDRVESLLRAQPRDWKVVWERNGGRALDDDPIPAAVIETLPLIDLGGLRLALGDVPKRSTADLGARITRARERLNEAFAQVWREILRQAMARASLLILDEAHHLKNPNMLRSLFDTGDDVSQESLSGALREVFDRMLLLTATPFQLGHQELISVLRLFGSTRIPRAQLEAFESTIKSLSSTLDHAQRTSDRLNRLWGRLRPDDIAGLPEGWWVKVPDGASENARAAAAAALEAAERLRAAEAALRPWVVRHTKDRQRTHLAGSQVLPGGVSGAAGLPIERSNVLPFLLAARAQAYVAQQGLQQGRNTRALFADGLASSFEAYLSTGRAADGGADREEGEPMPPPVPGEIDWYLARITAALPVHDLSTRASHPKVRATIDRAMHHWREGEKVLIFCFYRATTRALREHLSAAMSAELAALASERFGISSTDTTDLFEQLGERSDSILRRDRPGGRFVYEQARDIGRHAELRDVDQDALGDVTLSFLRSPGFLLRFVDLSATSGAAAVEQSFENVDGSGLTLGRRLELFAGWVKKLTDDERTALWEALRGIDKGLDSAGSRGHLEQPEFSRTGSRLLPNIRIAYGETDRDVRRRLMQTFNTPFFPEILIASSVMAEGVDLHRECRHLIHHDLDWNPSTLEQRTGRLDRIGSKSEATGRPIIVCEPFVSGTQDEKQYRVVKDRERWFGVLMGGRVPEDEWETDRIAERVPLPDDLYRALTIDLAVWTGTSSAASG